MKPAPFAYARPDTRDEAVALLSRHKGEAKVLAGGQSLIPMLNMRAVRAPYLVDINGLEELAQISVDAQGLVIGALARHEDVAESPLVNQHAPLLAEAARRIGHPAIRCMGTSVGSIMHADPFAQLPAAFLTLDGEAVVHGSAGVRSVKASDLFVGAHRTSVDPSGLVTHIRVPGVGDERVGWAFLEVVRQKGHFPLLAVATRIAANEHGEVVHAGIGFAGMGPTPVRASAAEEILREGGTAEEVIEAAAEAAAGAGDPIDDVHATRRYRQRAAAPLCRRALQQALTRAFTPGHHV